MNTFFNSFVVFLFFILSSQLSFAADNCRKLENLRNDAKALIYKARAFNLQGVDGHSYADILTAIDKPCLREAPRGWVIQEGQREGAYYEPSDKVVYLNSKPLAEMSLEQRGTLILHELLGAAGFSDREYQMTLQLVLLSRQDVNPRSLIGSTLKNRSEASALSGGSGTSVGGGGDILAIRIKSALIETLRALENTGRTTYNNVNIPELLRLVLDCPLDFAKNVAGFTSAVSMDIFIPGVVQPEDPGFKLAHVPMLNTSINRSWAAKQPLNQLAIAVLNAMTNQVSGLPEKQICNMPFFPYIKINR